MEKISVIVPIYKVENYLERCIQSIQKQTYQNLEIILVDDGSPDACGEICDRYARQDERIRVIHKPNGGLSDARNVGIEAAAGEYLAFVDSDDWVDQRMYEVLYKNLKKYDADIAECSYRSFYDGYVVEETQCTGNILEADPEFALGAMLEWKYFKPIACNKLYRRKVIGQIRFPINKIHEDEFTTYKYIYQAKKLIFIDFSFYNYDRRRLESITGKDFREENLDSCEAFRERINFFELHGLKKLERKMNNIYCWHVLESAYKCYMYGMNGEKVKLLVKQVRRDIPYLEKHEVDPWFVQEFRILARGIVNYGIVRSERERK